MLCAFVDSISEVSALLADPVIPLMDAKGAELLLQGGGGGGGGHAPPADALGTLSLIYSHLWYYMYTPFFHLT